MKSAGKLEFWLIAVAVLVVVSMGAFASIVTATEVQADRSSELMLVTPTPTDALPIGTFSPPSEAVVTAIPAYMPVVEGPTGHDILNILLLGSDTSNSANAGRTDAIMVVSLNRSAGTVSLLSIPRDLFVYIPGWTMQRINTAFGYGQQQGGDEAGYRLIKETIAYNLGLRIDFYARVDFNDFQYIIDALGGIDITVDCALQDWQLIESDMDPGQEENWHLVTLPVGVQHLDGYTALWYARSRRTSSDFDRGRRQQDLMRAIWYRVNELGLIQQVPALWGQLNEIVDTDMGITDIVGLAPMALSLDPSKIAHYAFQSGEHVRAWVTPGGSSVQLPVAEEVAVLVQRFMMPPTANRLVQGGATVEVLNASGYAGMDRVAADRLAWDGFVAIPGGLEGGQYRYASIVYDYTGRTKGSALAGLLASLRLPETAIVVQPDPGRQYDYRVVLGGDFRACIHSVMPPVPTPTPESQTGE